MTDKTKKSKKIGRCSFGVEVVALVGLISIFDFEVEVEVVCQNSKYKSLRLLTQNFNFLRPFGKLECTI